VPLFDTGPELPGYERSFAIREIAPLGPGEAIEPRTIESGLLDSRE
jgi:hypothetical protein